MKTFLIVSLGIMALAAPFIALYLASNWKRLIWESKGRVFRIRTYGRYWKKDKPFWVAEKRFLWFYVNCSGILHADDFYTKEDAIKCVSEYLQKLDKKQNPESYIIDYNKFISDPTRLIESRELETKRIDYDKD